MLYTYMGRRGYTRPTRAKVAVVPSLVGQDSRIGTLQEGGKEIKEGGREGRKEGIMEGIKEGIKE
jgi:hypothetical protein